jgi:hypothetical protein
MLEIIFKYQKIRMMSENRNKATLEIISRKNTLLEKLVNDTLVKIKKFSGNNNQEYQKLVRSLILEVKIKFS